jgi:hypothetical protein
VTAPPSRTAARAEPAAALAERRVAAQLEPAPGQVKATIRSRSAGPSTTAAKHCARLLGTRAAPGTTMTCASSTATPCRTTRSMGVAPKRSAQTSSASKRWTSPAIRRSVQSPAAAKVSGKTCGAASSVTARTRSMPAAAPDSPPAIKSGLHWRSGSRCFRGSRIGSAARNRSPSGHAARRCEDRADLSRRCLASRRTPAAKLDRRNR